MCLITTIHSNCRLSPVSTTNVCLKYNNDLKHLRIWLHFYFEFRIWRFINKNEISMLLFSFLTSFYLYNSNWNNAAVKSKWKRAISIFSNKTAPKCTLLLDQNKFLFLRVGSRNKAKVPPTLFHQVSVCRLCASKALTSRARVCIISYLWWKKCSVYTYLLYFSKQD